MLVWPAILIHSRYLHGYVTILNVLSSNDNQSSWPTKPNDTIMIMCCIKCTKHPAICMIITYVIKWLFSKIRVGRSETFKVKIKTLNMVGGMIWFYCCWKCMLCFIINDKQIFLPDCLNNTTLIFYSTWHFNFFLLF